MSEYQYYEFRAIDAPLSATAMTTLRRISSRAEITPTSMQVEYNYGNFKGDPRSLVAKYFDAFAYVTNWGTRQLMFRHPRRVLDPKAVSPYCAGDALRVRTGGDYVIVEFHSDEESDEWEEGEGWLTSLTGIRAELAAGDYRSLYVGWLLGQQAEDDEDDGEEEDDEDGERGGEPPVPAGLSSLTPAQKRLVKFLRVEPRAITAAAKRSAPGTRQAGAAGPTRVQMQKWVRELPATRKDQVLVRLLDGSDPFVGAQLQREFRTAVLAGPAGTAKTRQSPGPRAKRRRA